MSATQALVELRDKQTKLVADARAKLDEITDDTDESRAKEIESEYDKIMADYDTHEQKAKALEDRDRRRRELEERERDLDRPDPRRPRNDGRADPTAQEDEGKAKTESYRNAFRSFLRYGAEAMTADERRLLAGRRDEVRSLLGDAEARAQGVATTGVGGALVPEGFMAELIASLKAFGPMNDGSVVRVLNTASGNSIPWPTVDDSANKGAIIAENTQVTTQDVTFATKTIDAFKYTSKLILVASELLQDSALNVDQLINNLIGERLGRIYNEHFTTGTGSSQPNGIVTASAQGIVAASATAITADELIDMEHSVDPAYRSDPSARFMFNDTVFKLIRKLKDGQGNYLWQPADLRVGAGATLLGYPFSVNQDMVSPAINAKTIVFGAMNRYVVRFVAGLAIRRLVERYADFDQVGFLGFTRADGELLDTAAVKHLKQAAA